MPDDFYPFVDSGDPAPDNAHLQPADGGARPMRTDAPLPEAFTTGDVQHAPVETAIPAPGFTAAPTVAVENPQAAVAQASLDENGDPVSYATRIAVYDDLFSTPRVIVIAPKDVRTYLEEVTNTVYRCMKEQGGSISLMVIREIVENFIHANFVEPIISILDDGNTIRFADQGPGIDDKERAFEFGVTSADRDQKRYIRGTGAGFPMVQQYLEHAGGAVSIEDNLHQGTVVTVSIDPARVVEIERVGSRGGAVRGATPAEHARNPQAGSPATSAPMAEAQQAMTAPQPHQMGAYDPMGAAGTGAAPGAPAPYGSATNPYEHAAGMVAAPGADPALAGAPTYGAPTAPQPYQQQPWGYQPQQQPYAPAYGYPQQPYPAQPQPYPGYQQGYAAPGYPGAYQAQPWGPAPYGQAQPAGAWSGAPGMQAPMGAAAHTGAHEPYVSERGQAALRYLAEHGSGGPTDLTNALGSSSATWSRELEALTQAGLVIKRGQKRMLTEVGKLWADEHR